MKYALLLSLFAALACSSNSGSSSGCTQGETQECLCVEGGKGVQKCLDGGNAWGDCQGCQSVVDGGVDALTREDALVPRDTVPADSALPEDLFKPDTPVTPPDDTGKPDPDEGCQPDCGGKECGDDGCGAACGQCDEDKVCQDGLCGCQFAACGEVCCPEGDACFEQACCTPDCTDKECGDDGCGGLCNGCLDILYDDGDTDTAFGYSTPPGTNPEKIACVVRFDLPQEGMTLTQFTAGWMWGLYNLEVPFELAWLEGGDVECEDGPEGAWYKQWCETTPDKLHKIGDFIPLEPYAPMGTDLLGEVVFPVKTIYMAALFTVDEYPIYVCPLDTSGDGSLAYMMPQYEKTQGVSLDGPSFDQSDGNVGVIPFRIRVVADLPQ